MSDPHPSVTSSLSCFLEPLLDQQYDSLEYIGSSDLLPEKGTRWCEWDDFDVAMGVTDNALSQSDSELDVAKVEGWVGGDDHHDHRQQVQPVRKKRKLQSSPSSCTVRDSVDHHQVQLAGIPASGRERQRGKNWEKAEEDILVDAKRKEMDWKSISESLKEHGFVRNHKHCADKWYALRKHYLEIHQWMADHPNIQYWDRSDGERIRSVPPSFCQKWYQIFDAAEKREGRKKSSQTQRRKSDSLAITNFSLRSDSAFQTQPSCSLSDGLQLQHAGGDHNLGLRCSGDAALGSHKIEQVCHDDGFFFSSGATNPGPGNVNIQVLVAEIHNLSCALSLKFEAEEKERARNFEIKERKLDLKVQRFEYKRQRDDEKRKTVAQCLNVAVKAYD